MNFLSSSLMPDSILPGKAIKKAAEMARLVKGVEPASLHWSMAAKERSGATKFTGSIRTSAR